VTDEPQPAGERNPLRVSLGILFFLLVIVLAVLIVGIVSVRSLLEREAAVLDTWSEIQTILSYRRNMLADIIQEVNTAGHTLLREEPWLAARVEADTAPAFTEEVPAVAALDTEADRLLLEIRQIPGIDSLGQVAVRLAETDRLQARLGIARLDYNERVREYLGQRARIPTRWFARLFGFDEVPEYLRVVVR
jgi:hypothetical protein